MKKIFLIVAIFSVLLVSCGDNDAGQASYEIEEIESAEIKEEPKTELEAKIEESEESSEIVNLFIDTPEEDFKNICVEMYNDDFFKETQPIGTCVKVNLMASSKYIYYPSDIQAILVEDITENYGLEMECLGCCVMHESTKDDAVPSYFGEQIYVMFENGAEINMDIFKTGEKFVLYGIVIQNQNGTYIMPKYYEVVE